MRIVSILFGKNPTYTRSAKVLEYTAQKYSPEAKFELIKIKDPLKEMELHLPKRSTGHNANNALKTLIQSRIVNEAEDKELLCLMDADTFITGDLTTVKGIPFDLAVTDKEGLQIRAPINTGVVFVWVDNRTREWFTNWWEKVSWLMKNPQELRKWKKTYLGINQSGLAMMMKENHGLRIEQLPCSIWNCTTVGWPRFSENTKVVHILGQLRQTIFRGIHNKSPKILKLARMWRQLEKEALIQGKQK